MSLEVDGQRYKEIEVIAAEMENRLRESVLRVLRPTLSQVSELDMLHRDLKRRVDEDGKSIGKVDELQSDVIKNGHLVKALEEAVTSTSDQVRDMEATSSKRFVQLQTAFDLSQSTLSGYKNDIMRLEREDTRIWDEATRLQKQHDEDVSNNRDAVNGCHKRIIRVREECDAALLVMNQQREQLLEDLFGEDRGLSQLNKDLKKLTDFVSPIPDLIREMAENQRAVKNMAKRQEAFEKEFVQNRHDWQEYVQTQDVAVADMKATFKKECNFLVAHNSQIMKDIRRDYAKEMEHIQEMREGITKTLEQLGQTLHTMEDKLAIERRRIDTIHCEITKEIDDLHKWRNTDRAFMEADIHQFRTEMKAEKDTQTQIRSQVDTVTRLMGLLLEGCRVGCALSIQDFADRSRERWLCMSGERPDQAEPMKPSELEKQRQRKDMRFSDMTEVIADLKSRGLMRSGYQPGKVLFSGHNFDRRDLLILNSRLLVKAQQAYSESAEIAPSIMQVEKPEKPAPPRSMANSLKGHETAQNDHKGLIISTLPVMKEGQEEDGTGYPPKRSTKGPQPAQSSAPRRMLASSAGFDGIVSAGNTQSEWTKLPAIQSARTRTDPPKVATPPTSRPGTGNFTAR